MTSVEPVSNTGYSGYIATDLKGEVNSSIEQDVSRRAGFSLYKKTNINDDKLAIDLDTMASRGPGLYVLDSMYQGECGLKTARDIQVSQPCVNFNGGKGWIAEKGCLVDNDTKLRQEPSKLTNANNIHQIVERFSQTTPNYTKGFYDVNVESVIRPGDISSDQRPCNSLSGVSIGNYFTPMIPKLKTEVQDTNHIIPEDSMDVWVRGGLPTRQMQRNSDYLRRCKEKTH
jgi:hypothetical protein